MNNIILGDNQFYGVNHMSESKSIQQQEKFTNIDNIFKIIDYSVENGVNGLMLHSSDLAEKICERIRNNNKYSDLILYPTIPHPVKYMNLVTDKGIAGGILSVIKGSKAKDIAKMFINAGSGLINKDISDIMKILIDLELKPFENLNVGCVFLQNMATDLTLSIGMQRMLLEYNNYINEKYKLKAAYQTANLPYLFEKLKNIGVCDPIIMSPINKAGFFMNPNKEACERIILNNKKLTIIPMSVLASGAINPYEAFSYVINDLKCNNVIFGASSKDHIKKNIDIIKGLMQKD